MKRLLVFAVIFFLSTMAKATLDEVITAITTIRPGAEWSLVGDTYDGLIWLDQVQTKPTRTEIINEVISARAKIERQKVWEKRINEYPHIQQQILMILTGGTSLQILKDKIEAVDLKYPLP